MPVGERYRRPREHRVAARIIHDGHALDDFRPVTTVAAGVHVDSTTDRPRHPDEDMKAGVPGSGRASGREGGGQSGSYRPEISVLTQVVEILSKAYDEGVETFIGKE